jgi:hypothetical protein
MVATFLSQNSPSPMPPSSCTDREPGKVHPDRWLSIAQPLHRRERCRLAASHVRPPRSCSKYTFHDPAPNGGDDLLSFRTLPADHQGITDRPQFATAARQERPVPLLNSRAPPSRRCRRRLRCEPEPSQADRGIGRQRITRATSASQSHGGRRWQPPAEHPKLPRRRRMAAAGSITGVPWMTRDNGPISLLTRADSPKVFLRAARSPRCSLPGSALCQALRFLVGLRHGGANLAISL